MVIYNRTTLFRRGLGIPVYSTGFDGSMPGQNIQGGNIFRKGFNQLKRFGQRVIRSSLFRRNVPKALDFASKVILPVVRDKALDSAKKQFGVSPEMTDTVKEILDKQTEKLVDKAKDSLGVRPDVPTKEEAEGPVQKLLEQVASLLGSKAVDLLKRQMNIEVSDNKEPEAGDNDSNEEKSSDQSPQSGGAIDYRGVGLPHFTSDENVFENSKEITGGALTDLLNIIDRNQKKLDRARGRDTSRVKEKSNTKSKSKGSSKSPTASTMTSKPAKHGNTRKEYLSAMDDLLKGSGLLKHL